MFWDTFYSLCLSNGKKPLNVVNELKIAGASITKWKNGSIPNGNNLKKIADYFGISVDTLLGKESSDQANMLEENTVQYCFEEKTVTKHFKREQMEAIVKMLNAIPEK